MYTSADRMSELVEERYELLRVLSRFNIALGFGDKSIECVCREQQLDVNTFLAVVNMGESGSSPSIESVSVRELMTYLRNAHAYFLDFSLPMIRRKLSEAVLTAVENEVSRMILHYFDAYTDEVKRHMAYEEQEVFPHVEALLRGEQEDYSIEEFARQHRVSDDDYVIARITELKNILIKYYPSEGKNELLYSVLFDVFTYQRDLAMHCRLENELFIPAVRLLTGGGADCSVKDEHSAEVKDVLSARERDIIIGVVKGMTNKEIADSLFLSVHTVTTHRKNIARKLRIHSPAGLTIYAIVNKLVALGDLPDIYTGRA